MPSTLWDQSKRRAKLEFRRHLTQAFKALYIPGVGGLKSQERAPVAELRPGLNLSHSKLG